MYRCHVCHKVSEPNQNKLTHAILRPVARTSFIRHVFNADKYRMDEVITDTPDRYEIDQEIAVCPAHKLALDNGESLSSLMITNAEKRRLAHIKPPKIKPERKHVEKKKKKPPVKPVEVFLVQPIKLKGAARVK